MHGDLKYDGDLLLSVYDAPGRLIHSEKVAGKGSLNQEINIGDKASKGVYFATLKSGTQTVKTFKVVVE